MDNDTFNNATMPPIHPNGGKVGSAAVNAGIRCGDARKRARIPACWDIADPFYEHALSPRPGGG